MKRQDLDTKDEMQHGIEKKRHGDTVPICGDYQYRALTGGNVVQRFWHYSKRLAIQKYLPPEPSDTILDAGCGSGVITSFLGESGAGVTGVDGNIEAIKFADSAFRKENINFRVGFVDEDIEIEHSFDKIYCLEVIEHIYYAQAKKMLKGFHKILKPDGKVFLTTPNYRSLWPLIEWTMDIFCMTPAFAEQHVEFYHKRKLKDLCTEAGFKVRTVKTNCFIAPWLAPLSWRFATKINDLENRSSSGGSILIFVLEKQPDTSVSPVQSL